MGMIKLRAVVEVEYDTNGVSPEDLRHKLIGALGIGYRDGLLTGSTPAEVENYEVKVEDAEKIGSVKWSTIDIIDRAKDRGLKVTDEQAKEILNTIIRKHDAELGINWDVIDAHTDFYLNQYEDLTEG